MKLSFLVAAVPLIASGCAGTLPPEVIASGDLTATTATARPIHYHNPVGAYTHRIPVDPKPWRNQNDAQAPKGAES